MKNEILLDEMLEVIEDAKIEWRSKEGVDTILKYPFELRMFFLMLYFEGEISNGGLAQFLWNTYYHWTFVLDECEMAYDKIGAYKQAHAMASVRTVIERNLDSCLDYITKAIKTQDSKYFLQWYSTAEEDMTIPEEDLFADDVNLDLLRDKWIVKNKEKLIAMLKEQSCNKIK